MKERDPAEPYTEPAVDLARPTGAAREARRGAGDACLPGDRLGAAAGSRDGQRMRAQVSMRSFPDPSRA